MKLAVLLAALCLAAEAQPVASSRLLSGNGDDRVTAIAADRSGFIYIAGTTTSGDFPVTTGSFRSTPFAAALRFSATGRTFVPAGLRESAVSAVAASADGAVIYAASSGGVFRSGDGGETWLKAGSLPLRVTELAVDPVDPNTAYAALPDSRIFRTSDGGRTWAVSLASDVLSSGGYGRILIDPREPRNIYALTGSAVFYKSVDGGESWKLIRIPDPSGPSGQFYANAIALAPSEPRTLYAAGTGLLRKSRDGGETWAATPFNTNFGTSSIAVDPHDPAVVWLAGLQGVLRSSDSGETFQRKGIDGENLLNSVVIDPSNPDRVLVASNADAYISVDAGAHWERATSGVLAGSFATSRGFFVAAQVPETAYVAKLSADLRELVYATYVGPAVSSELGLAVGADGSVAVTGQTTSRDFPTTPGALQRELAGFVAGFAARLNSDGSTLEYSTLLNGMQPNAVAVENDGSVIIGGTAAPGRLPLIESSLQKERPAGCTRGTGNPLGFQPLLATSGFLLKLDTAGELAASTYLGGACGDLVSAIALDEAGRVYATGETYSFDFPVTSGTGYPGIHSSAFIARLGPNLDRIEESRLFGGGFFTAGRALSLAAGGIYIAGRTQANATEGAYRKPAGPGCAPVISIGPSFPRAPLDGANAFIARFDSVSSPARFLATIGGGCLDEASSIAVEPSGEIWLAGWTSSSDFPTKAPAAGLGRSNGFLARFNSDASELLFSATAAGPADVVQSTRTYFSGTTNDPSKTASPLALSPGAVLVAQLDGSVRTAIALDRISTIGTVDLIPPFYSPPAIAPGQMVKLTGRGIGPAEEAKARLDASGRLATSIGGVRVLVNGTPAPLVRARADEIVAFVPFGVDGARLATIQVEFGGERSNAYEIGVAQQLADYVSIANADGTANSPSTPAKPGDVVALYVTGLGQTTPPSVDGEVIRDARTLRTMPQVFVNGFSTKPSFIGAAPGQVAGITQVNIVAPAPLAGTNFSSVYVGSAFARIYVGQP